MSVYDRLVSVDNADPQFKWDGPWFSTQGNTEDLGDNGPPFLSTLQGITTNGGLTFSFSGRGVALWGSLRPQNITGGRGRDPDWDCFVDGNNIGQPRAYPTTAQSNFLLCWGKNITDGNHTLELRATVQTQTLWVDQAQYRAASDVDISGAWTEVDQDDGRFQYSEGWVEDSNGYRRSTNIPGAWLTYDFNGEAVIIGAYTPGSSTVVDGLASYIVDGGPSTDFRIPATTVTKSNQPYFQITGLTPGPHRLQVTNKGNSSTAPLAFSYMYTKNARPVPTAEPKPNKLPAIIGGAVGGGLGAILLAVLLVFFFLNLRNRREKRKTQMILAPAPVITEERTGTHSVLSKEVTGTTYVSPTQSSPNSNPWNGQYQPPVLQHHNSQPLLSQYPSSSQLSPSQPPPALSIVPQPAPPSQSPPSQNLAPSLYPASSQPPPQPALSHSSSFSPQRRSPPATLPQSNAWSNIPEPQLDMGRMTYLQTMDGKPDDYNPYQFSKDSK